MKGIAMKEKMQWYLPNDQILGADGPFSHEDILHKLQKKELTADFFIWGSHLKENRWVRIMEVPEFSTHILKYPAVPVPKKRSTGSSHSISTKNYNFASREGEYGIENEYRRFPRVPFQCEVIIHNQKEILRCSAQDISEKGLSVRLQNCGMKCGENVIVTLLDSGCAGTFSVSATIMRVLDGPFQGLGLYFLTINPSVRRKIAEFVIDSLDPVQVEKKIA